MESQSIVVMKFGGTSVGCSPGFRNIKNISEREARKIIIVASAMSGITNSLIEIVDYCGSARKHDAIELIDDIQKKHLSMAMELEIDTESGAYIVEKCDELRRLVFALDILGEVSPKSSDLILAYGELLSTFLLYNYLKKTSKKVDLIPAGCFITTDSSFGEAKVDIEQTCCKSIDTLNNNIDSDIVITQGFAGIDPDGKITTLGRGGSDYSAALIAKGIQADELDIYTDVNGMMTTDPRIVPEAMIISKLSYIEASELAFFGAKVLHPKTIYPAITANIPVFVKNTFQPDFPGTEITTQPGSREMVKAIAVKKGITVVNVHSDSMLGSYGFLKKVFDIFDKYETSVDLVTTSEVNISMTIDNDKNIEKVINDLQEFSDVSLLRKKSILSAVGDGIKQTAGIASRFFNALRGINISMISLGASEVNLSIIVDDENAEKAVTLLHNEFFSNIRDTGIFIKI